MNFFSANKHAFGVITFLVFFFVSFFFFFSAPLDFPVETVFKIEQGNSLRSVSLKLKNERIIRSRLVFEALVIIFDREKRLIGADYLFEKKLSVWEIAGRIAKGEYMAPIEITIPEGFNTVQIADTFASKLPNFNKNKFLLESKDLEGYLFPDTYFFSSTTDEEVVLKSMRENFNRKIALVRPDIIASKKSESEIIIMASIIEGEAKGDVDRGFISGILWKRLAISMSLQVDVAPETYKTKGLPKNPVGNPGGEAIKAAIYPQNSSYLYYLHDKNGNIHYAKSFFEHRQNVLKYLK